MKIPAKISHEMKKYPAFYQMVWRYIFTIPKGKAMSYGQVAAALGRPKAARAVGNAVKKNPFAPIIPCHRVIAKDGSLGGYSASGGIKKKIELLKKEGYAFQP